MHIVRYRPAAGGPVAAGLLLGDRVVPLGETLAPLWSATLAELREELAGRRPDGSSLPLEAVRLAAPVDGRTEVWACGVTYEISREARVEESEHAADVYRRVYDAERPELFFKAVPWKVSGSGEPIAVRSDSSLDVPEPELALVCNRHGEIVGYTACNDVSSRSIEGENPLYLPQAKVYLGSCALGPTIRPAWEVSDPYALAIDLAIERAGEEVWRGSTTTGRLHRRLDELARYLFLADRHPEGAVLSTGTCLVPEAPFSLADGDVVRVGVEGVGTLENPVVRGLEQLEAARASLGGGAGPSGGGAGPSGGGALASGAVR